jgi:hypothetical protein
MNDAVQQVTVLKQNKLIDRYTALNMIYVDKNEKQIRDMMKLIDEEEEKAMKLEQSKVEPQGTSDEDFEQKNNTDINHVKSVE